MLNELINISVIILSAIVLLVVEHYTFKTLLITKQWKYWQFFIIKAFDRPLKSIIVLIGILYLIELFYISNDSFFTSENFETAKMIIFVSCLTWGALGFIKRLEKYFLKTNYLSKHNDKERHRSTIILLMKLCFVTTLMIGILILLHTLGIKMQAIITFISLSGVAIGISSRDLIASFFGTIFVYTNGPFSIGDRIKINSFEGNVENITWLSTCLRLDNRNLIYIPNIQFLNATVENISYAHERRMTVILSIFHFNSEYTYQLIEEITEFITESKIYLENTQYNPKASYELLESNENQMIFKIRVYFNKYTAKQELSLQKLKINHLISKHIISNNIRFHLKIED